MKNFKISAAEPVVPELVEWVEATWRKQAKRPFDFLQGPKLRHV
jgi:hypothetical protein